MFNAASPACARAQPRSSPHAPAVTLARLTLPAAPWQVSIDIDATDRRLRRAGRRRHGWRRLGAQSAIIGGDFERLPARRPAASPCARVCCTGARGEVKCFRRRLPPGAEAAAPARPRRRRRRRRSWRPRRPRASAWRLDARGGCRRLGGDGAHAEEARGRPLVSRSGPCDGPRGGAGSGQGRGRQRPAAACRAACVGGCGGAGVLQTPYGSGLCHLCVGLGRAAVQVGKRGTRACLGVQGVCSGPGPDCGTVRVGRYLSDLCIPVCRKGDMRCHNLTNELAPLGQPVCMQVPLARWLATPASRERSERWHRVVHSRTVLQRFERKVTQKSLEAQVLKLPT